MSAGDTPFSPAAGGVRVAVRVSPRAARNRVGGLAGEADGGRVLQVAVTAAPEGGKANRAAVELLAKAWRVPRSSISVTAGAGARRKTLHVAGETDALMRRLGEWMENQGE